MVHTTLLVMTWVAQILVVVAVLMLLANAAADWIYDYFGKLAWRYRFSKYEGVLLTLRDYCSILTYLFFILVLLVTYLLHLKNHWP
jgi:hypothetical protein